MRRIGTLTSGIVLLGVGILLTIDTVFHRHWFSKVAPFWPLIFVAIGIEVLWAFYDTVRTRTTERVRIDFRSVGLLAAAAVVSAVFSTSEQVFSRVEQTNASSVTAQLLNSLRDHPVQLPELKEALGSNRHIRIQNWKGSITVTGGPGDLVQIDTVVHVNGAGSDQDADLKQSLEHAMPMISSDDGLKVSIPADTIDVNRINTIDLKLTVPRGVSVILDGRNGDQSVTNVIGDVSFFAETGKITGSTISGSVSVQQNEGQTLLNAIGGNVSVSSKSGSINLNQVGGSVNVNSDLGDLTMQQVFGTIRATCKSGGIHATDILSDAWLESGIGPIQVTNAHGALTAKTEEGNISADSDVLGDYQIRSTKGVVTLRIPKTASIHFDGFSNRGVVKGPLTNALSSPQGAHVVDNLNDGTYHVNVTTDDGAVMVNLK